MKPGKKLKEPSAKTLACAAVDVFLPVSVY
jgi:hypothetical protein